ncbi:MAG: N-acetyl-gamma-glutamyl-phosphate reductase [Chitinophagaceae bacterium]|nr:N-acetyl-gamma-glutamyl-phosphate reductase [Chitinophagaceae bacterium]
MIKVGVVGGAGYTGGELIRLLIHHPQVQVLFVQSNSNAGNPVYSVHKDLYGETNLLFSATIDVEVDIIFLCVGHGDAVQFLNNNTIPDSIKIIDLSQDFRLQPKSVFGTRSFVYGLPELNKDKISVASNIANPGCFATAIQLGLLPLSKVGLLSNVYTTGITGSTGAGQSLNATSHFSWRANNIQAYKTLNHQHIAEISESINAQGIHFVPWRGDFTRGIYVSSTLDSTLTQEALYDLYQNFYNDAVFTHVSDTMIDLKQVVNTNKCLIHIEKVGNKVVIHSCIDNLLKGASGQALQNMNIMFGIPEKTGLQLKTNYF